MKSHEIEVLRICILKSRMGKSAKVESSYRNIKAGFSGEEKTTAYLMEANLTPKVSIYRHINLDNTQYDIIVVTQKLICVLEVKNMTGEFYFDSSNKQFYRIKNGLKEGMRNPELQLQRAVKVLQKRLNRNGVDFPVKGLIILASRAGIVIESPTLFQAVPIDAMCDFLEQMESDNRKLMTHEELKKVRHIIKRNGNKVYETDILEHHGVTHSSIKTGVRCLKCFEISMTRIFSTWLCTRCSHRDKGAHIAALQEYQLLFGREVSSDRLKWWLGMEDKYFIKRIVKEVSENSIGSSRTRTYVLSFKPWVLEPFLTSELRKN